MTGRPIRISVLANGRQAKAELTGVGAAAGRLGAGLTKLGKITAGVFAVERLAHFGKELFSEASKFQSSITLLETAGGEAHKNLAGITSGIIGISNQVGTSVDDLSEGMYLMEKAGLRGAAGLHTLKLAAEGARAENVDLATETQAVTSIMTSYHVKAKDAASVVNELVEASGQAKTTMQSFAGSLAAVLPSASAAGLGFDQVGAAIATLTQHGTSADEATQELANTIRNLQAPNMVASKEMQQLGINVTDLSKNLGKRGLTGTIDLVVNAIGKHLGKSGLVMLDAFKKSQSAGADLQIMLKSMPKPLRDVSQSFLDGKRSLKDYTADVKGFGGKAAAMGTQFKSLVTSSQGFNELLKSGSPAAQTFTDALKRMLGGATGMNTALQLSGENMDAFKKRADKIGESGKKNGKDIATWGETANTAAVQWGKLSNTLKNLGLQAALKTLPYFTRALKSINAGLAQGGKIRSWAKDTFGPWRTTFVDVRKLAEDTFKPFESGGAGGSALKTFSGLVKTTARGVSLLARGLDAIPGPMKKFAVEVGGAALALGLLSRATTAFTGSRMVTALTGLSGGLRSYASDLRTTMAASSTFGPQTEQVAAAQGRLAAQYQKVGSAARSAAGIGGVLLLVNAMQKTSSKASALEGALGGVAAGFAVGGPWGAAIGGAAGLLGGIFSAKSNRAKAAQQALAAQMQATKEAAAEQNRRIADLVDTLNQYTGATTVATRTKILDNLLGTNGGKDAIKLFQQAGVSTYTLISAIEGIPAATKKTNAAWATMQSTMAVLEQRSSTLSTKINGLQINIANGLGDSHSAAQLAALQQQKAAIDRQVASYKGLAGAVGTAISDQRGAIRSFRQTAAAAGVTAKNLGVTKKEWNSWPRIVQTQIHTNFPTVLNGPAGLKSFAKQVKLTPRQIRVIAKFDGLDLSKKQIANLSNSFKALPKTGTAAGKVTASSFSDALSHGGTRWSTTIKAATAAATKASTGTASSGGAEVGSNYGHGVLLGIGRWTDPIANAARQQVLNAIAAANSKAGQDAHSPAHKTRDRVGLPFSQGIAVGIAKGGKGVDAAARKVVNHAITWAVDGVKVGKAQSLTNQLVKSLSGTNISGGAGGLTGELNGIFDSIKGSVDRAIKDRKKQAAADKGLTAARGKLLKSIKDEKKALHDLGREQDALNSGNLTKYLDKNDKLYKLFSKMPAAYQRSLQGAKQWLSSLKQDAASLKSAISDSVASFTDVTTFGANPDTGVVSFSGLVLGMQAATAQTQKWASGIKKLAKLGLRKELLQQLISGGPADYPTVLAILGAGKAGITQVNALNKSSTDAATSLGAFAANDFYGAGIQAANGLIRGLQARDKQLRKAAKHIADAIADEIKKALGIHSPSTVFRDLGKFSVQGLAIGLDSTYVRSQGQRISKDLLIGFGTPALKASATMGAQPAQTVNLSATLRLSAEQLSQLQRGLQIKADLDALESVKVRTVRR